MAASLLAHRRPPSCLLQRVGRILKVKQVAETGMAASPQIVDNLFGLRASVSASPHSRLQGLLCCIEPQVYAPPLSITADHPIEDTDCSADVSLSNLGELLCNGMVGCRRWGDLDKTFKLLQRPLLRELSGREPGAKQPGIGLLLSILLAR